MLECAVKVKTFESVFVERVNDDEMFAINVATGTFVSIDEIGKLIIKFIVEPHSISDIIRKIKEEYDCEYDITNDIIEFITKAIDEKFIERV